ncbi:MAG TPA: sigma-70 family RNA polymerase sigma factor, partial [Planctomycetota bacterium]|nr:sigma-70 family RNA polymerase sigma factor [Planctomycetota bacterium]
MIRARHDRQFDRFRRTGDPRLLAKVFDATAAELWRVAVHLCRDRHAAEDAVQSTFLSALEARGEWDSSRPLLPWLLGHLGNRVREQRRATRVVDASRLEQRAEPDPATVVADREIGATCRDAIARLDEPYRSVLELHLVHGKAAHEIASELGIAAGTVRMRLHRGLDQLRQKLPAAIAGGVVAASQLSAASFASMRRAVLDAVPGGAVVAGSAHVSVVVGGMLMSKLPWVGAAVAAVLLSWLALPADRRAPEPPAVRLAAAGEPTRASLPDAAPGATSPAVAAADRTPADAPAAASGTLRVVVRNGGNMVPIAGVRVAVAPRTRGSTATRAAARGDREPAPVWTDAQGVAIVTAPAGPVTVTLRGPVSVDVDSEVPQHAERERVVDLPVLVSADVSVVDSDDRPVAGARIVGFTDSFVRGTREFGVSD